MAKKPVTPKTATPPVPPESAPAITSATMPPAPPVGPITSAAAPPAHAGPPPTKKGALLAKTKLGVPPTLLFRSGFQQVVRGDLHPGTVLTLYYSAARLPQATAGRTDWQATAYLRFGNGGEPLALPLYSPAGLVSAASANAGLDAGPSLTARTPAPIPADAQEVEVWFEVRFGDGQQFWDSNLGRNYHFRFTHALVVAHAEVVVPNPPAPNDDLAVRIETDTDVEKVFIDYQVTNTAPDSPQRGQAELTLLPELTPAGCRQWQVTGVCVPHRAVVYFTVGYFAGGHEFHDDNNNHGYLVS